MTTVQYWYCPERAFLLLDVGTVVPYVSGERTVQEHLSRFITTYIRGKLPTVRLFCVCAVLGFRLVVNKTSAVIA